MRTQSLNRKSIYVALNKIRLHEEYDFVTNIYIYQYARKFEKKFLKKSPKQL